MNLTEINQAFNLYRPGRVTGAKDITVGLANQSYLLDIDTGEKYVLRELRTQTPENAQTEAKLQQQLAGYGIVTPIYEQLPEGGVAGEAGGHRFTLSAYIQGSRRTNRSLALAAGFGKSLASLHNALADFDLKIIPSDAQWLNPYNAQQEIERAPEDLRHLLAYNLNQYKTILDKDLPRSIIHGDLMPDNTFIEGDEVAAIFDFETIEYTIRLLDIARTYLSFAYTQELEPSELEQTLLGSYNQTVKSKLTEAETDSFREAVQYAAVTCAAWLNNHNGKEFVKPYLAVASISI